MNSAPVTLPLTSSTTAAGESAAAGAASASNPSQAAIDRFIAKIPIANAGLLVAPAPEWFQGRSENTRPNRSWNRPIAFGSQPAQPSDAAIDVSRDAVGIVIFS